MLHKISLVIIMAITNLGVFAQEITGFVKDRESQEPIPFANIWIKGTTRGTMSDTNGQFVIKLSQNDTLCVSTIGYQKWEIPAKNIAENPFLVLMKE
nr:carboxypeptidase-like regulatory domain-containing protein [Sunxiuqinia sp.]